MAVAASVKTTIVIKGQDRASKEVRKADDSFKRLTNTMKRAEGVSARLGNALRDVASGNISGALSNVGGLLGGPGGVAGAAAAATVATGALAASVGAAAFKFTEWSVEIERSRAALDAAFGGDGVAKAVGFARTIGGVGVESVQKLAATLKASGITAKITAAELQELANRATQMGKTGDDALSAFADAIVKGNTRALAQVGVMINAGRVMDDYARSIGVTTTQLTQAQKQAAVLAAVQEDLTRKQGAASDMHSRQDDTLARLSVAWSRLKFEVSEYLGGPAVGILANIADTMEAMARFGRVLGALVKFVGTAATAQFRALGTAIGGVAAAAAIAVETGSIMKVADALDAAASDTIKVGLIDTKDALSELVTAIERGGAAGPKAVKQIEFVGSAFGSVFDGAVRAQAMVAGAAKAAAAASAAAAKRAAKAAAAARAASARRRKAAAEDAAFFSELAATQRADEVRALETRRSEVAAMAARRDALSAVAAQEMELARLRAAGDPAGLARLDRLQREAELQRQIAEIKANDYLTEIEQNRAIDAVKGMAQEREIAAVRAFSAAQRQATQATISGYIATGNAAANAMAQIGVSERAIAGIKAVMAGAEAYLAYARYDFAAGIAATAAALSFGKVALSSPDVPQGVPAVAAPAAAAQPSPAPSGGGNGGGGIVINVSGGFGTAAEIGAAVRAALNSAASSGMVGT